MSEKGKLQEVQKLATEARILTVLTKRHSMRWHDLKQATGLSSRTLSDRLHDLTDKGVVARRVDGSTRPPSAYYETTSQTVSELDRSGLYGVFQKYLDERSQSERLFGTSKEEPKGVVEKAQRELLYDFLLTLRYCMKNNDYIPYLVLLHTDLYQAQIQNLIDTLRKSPILQDELNVAYQKLVGQQEKLFEPVIEEALSKFQDKELAQSVLRLYYREAFPQKIELFVFLMQLTQNHETKERLSKEFGSPIMEDRLSRLISETAWTDLEASFSKSEQTSNV
jgi:DNA-binding Lrp family transcriptional regulator